MIFFERLYSKIVYAGILLMRHSKTPDPWWDFFAAYADAL